MIFLKNEVVFHWLEMHIDLGRRHVFDPLVLPRRVVVTVDEHCRLLERNTRIVGFSSKWVRGAGYKQERIPS